MIGAGVSAWFAGWLRESTGTYDTGWWTAGGLCLVAAVLSVLVPRGDAIAPDEAPSAPVLSPTDSMS